MIGPLPPHGRIEAFLDDATHDALLDWTLVRQHRFTPAKVRGADGSRTDDRQRIALKLRDVGPLEPLLRERLLAALPQVTAAAGSRGPEPRSLELELTAYGHGAFFGRHRDIPLGSERKPLGAAPGEDRLISAVYYFHRRPRSFLGGALRLFRFGADDATGEPGNFVDLDPLDNSLVAFPSWAVHEVRPVECRSGEFADFRFALNCWYCRPLSDHGLPERGAGR